MDNYTIADNFSLLAKLMDIHGENSFKTKSYSSASFAIEKLPVQLASLPEDKIFSIKGVGEAIGKKIIEQIQTGRLPLLDSYLEKTPAGILEMLAIKGIGPKKIAVIWKELEVESPGELLYACEENRLMLYKGFGQKTQQNIKEAIEFYLNNQGSFLYTQVEQYASEATEKMSNAFKDYSFRLTGDFERHLETIDKLEWVTDAPSDLLTVFFIANDYKLVDSSADTTSYRGKENLLMTFYHTNKNNFVKTIFEKTSSPQFFEAWTSLFPLKDCYSREEDIFREANIEFIPAFLRESATIIEHAKQKKLPTVITNQDITSVIHSHSKWSDGVNSIEEMATAAIKKGLQYLVLSDHSKSAFYANGLTEERLIEQHKEIDELNKRLGPFKIFKSIESDILNDGSLDYNTDVLQNFDLVIASVHSNLKMKEDKAMARLLKAIENPYTNILGHPTGRLLLSRNGYPIDHKTIIDACAAHNVVIELNAHPKRLDLDWRWIGYCIDKNVLISIDPDAHSIDGFNDIRYGVIAAQKAGVTKSHNLSSFSLAGFENFLKTQHAKRR
ncbi:MAG TPA: helix-hairpin-helix domain-containing protein [Panacibacter sp.]|nr:helix-hairpin-helix domain-containing protein [Panacibacter sp.]HNP46745.1 helix-hairpin-helix domain-containing protein [Panacibacter sp.]